MTAPPPSPRAPNRGNGNGSCDAANGGVSPRGDDRGDDARAAAAGHREGQEQAKHAGGKGIGSGENGIHDGSDATKNGYAAPTAASAQENGAPAKERGTKRFPEVELEATSPEILSGDFGAGARGSAGGGARARGKAPRSRKQSSPAARRASPAGSAAPVDMARESGGGGSSNRRAVVEAVGRCDFGREGGGGQHVFETT